MTLPRFSVWTAMILSAFVFGSCGGGSSSGGGTRGDRVFLNAFTDFNCSPGWANRDGALGRVAYSGSGTCQTTFPGESGVYAVFLTAQTESDGNSPYAVSLNGTIIGQGRYPYSTGRLKCDCSTQECPDRVVNLAIGIYEIEPGDTIKFFGDDVYQCGEHGAYAKWHGIEFTHQ